MGALTYAKVVATASVAAVDCNVKAVPAATKSVAAVDAKLVLVVVKNAAPIDVKVVPVAVPVLPATKHEDYAKLGLELIAKLGFDDGNALEPEVKAKYMMQLEHCGLILEHWGKVKPWYTWPIMNDELLYKEFNEALTSSRLAPPTMASNNATPVNVEPDSGSAPGPAPPGPAPDSGSAPGPWTNTAWTWGHCQH
jgi:hypothetical protein